MKNFYLILTFLLTLLGGGFAPALAQDVVEIPINANSGDYVSWNGNASNPWAGSWKSSGTPEVSFHAQLNGSFWTNNVGPWDGTNFQFFNTIGGSGTSHDYTFEISAGWEFVSVSLDFVASAEDKEVYVAVDGEKSEVNNSTTETVHYELTNIGKNSFVFTVGANVAKVFAKTTNFVVSVQERDPFDVIMDEIYALKDEYQAYTEEGTNPFHVGTDLGDYGAEEVAAFNAAYSACVAAGEPDYQGTADDLVVLRDALTAAYQAVMDSQIKFVIIDGYYRFRTGMKYNDGKPKYMYVEPTAGTTINGKWGTLDDLAENCHALWHLTKGEDGSWDIVSVSTDARFNSNPATLSEESEYRFVFEEVAMIGEDYYVDIRYVDKAKDGNSYIHQGGHGGGAYAGGNLTTWYPTFSGTTMAASEWVVELVPNEEAQEIINAYASIKERQQKEREYAKMVETSKTNLEIAKDIKEYTKYITDAATQFSSPWTESSEGIGKSGDWNELLDGVNTTYWHSAWSGGNVPNHTHYLQVALTEPVHELIQMKITRRPVANDHITLWGVWGATSADAKDAVLWTEDDELPEGVNVGDVKEPSEWVELASLATPFGNNTETKVSKEFDTQGYQYLRFYIDGTTNGRGYGHVSEFQLVRPIIEPNAQYIVMGELATNLEKVLADQIEVEPADMTDEQYNALKAAYDAFMEKFVDPAELRAAIKTAEASTAGIVVGTNPGEWGPDTDAGALATTVANAKAYDQSGDYTPAQTEQYIEDLNAQAGDILSSANKIEEGKWYRIHFGSKETFEANEWDIETNEATTVEDIHENAYVTNEALWDKFVTVAKYEAEKINIEVAHEPTEQDPSTSKEQEVTLNKVVPFTEDEDILCGAQIFFDADADITDKDCSLFRFVNVGDSAYVLQNKATGLFVGAYNNVRLDVQPSLFKVKAIGYGQNLITATNLITNANQSNLHFQRDNNVVVTYGESAVGSRSGLYIEEVEDVASDYDGTEFLMNLKPGSVNSFCYPVGLTVSEDYEMYDVVEVSKGSIKLNPIQEACPGRPFIFIADGDYDAEQDDAEPYPFYHDYSFTKEAIAGPLLKGTYSTIASLPKGAITNQGNGFVVSKSATMSMIPVPANTAYIQADEEFPLVDYTYEILEEPIEDGINTALQKVATNGELYTIDGRLINRKANLNDLKRYGKGIYILNGIKVTVK